MAVPDSNDSFRVSYLDGAVDVLRDSMEIARERGLDFELARDLEAIQRRLVHIPIVWGDPLFDFHQLGMTQYRGSSEFFFTYFSVNQLARQVFVQRFTIKPYSRLA